MATKADAKCGGCDLHSPRRNRYFYGKLLDADHFELETAYHNSKRWLLNRLVTGYGVVCGLDVKLAPDGKGIVVRPGLAIDRHGREIIVPEKTPVIPIPDHLLEPHEDDDDEHHIQVLLCYHECPVEPAPVMVGGCNEPEPCEAGVILERYRVELREGCVPKTGAELRIPDIIKGGEFRRCDFDYDRLVEIVSEECPSCPSDPCIPLAEIRVDTDDDGHCRCHQEGIDITVRPIVFSNDLLFQLLLSMMVETPSYRREK